MSGSNYRDRSPRPRADCPRCGRSTAVTWNKRTGEAYLRTHNNPTLGVQCTLSRQTVDRDLVSRPD
jgi:hypothetical protein